MTIIRGRVGSAALLTTPITVSFASALRPRSAIPPGRPEWRGKARMALSNRGGETARGPLPGPRCRIATAPPAWRHRTRQDRLGNDWRIRGVSKTQRSPPGSRSRYRVRLAQHIHGGRAAAEIDDADADLQ